MTPLSYRAAAVLLGCSHQTIANLLRSGQLPNLLPATVAAFTYIPKPGGRTRGQGCGLPNFGAGRQARVILNGVPYAGWRAAAATAHYSIAGLRKRATRTGNAWIVETRSRP